MWHGLILELCQNRTVISLSKRELIFLYLHTPLLPAIVPVISRPLNWIFWRRFWRGRDKAPPLEGNLPTPSSCLFSSLLFPCSSPCKGTSPSVLCLFHCHRAVWGNVLPAVMTSNNPRPLSCCSTRCGLCQLLKGLCGTSVAGALSWDQGPALIPNSPAWKGHWPWPGYTSKDKKKCPLGSYPVTTIQIGLGITPVCAIHTSDFVFCSSEGFAHTKLLDSTQSQHSSWLRSFYNWNVLAHLSSVHLKFRKMISSHLVAHFLTYLGQWSFSSRC